MSTLLVSSPTPSAPDGHRVADKLFDTQENGGILPSTDGSVDGVPVNTVFHWVSWGGILILEFVNRGSGVQILSLAPFFS
jgi:hypothetical protein